MLWLILITLALLLATTEAQLDSLLFIPVHLTPTVFEYIIITPLLIVALLLQIQL